MNNTQEHKVNVRHITKNNVITKQKGGRVFRIVSWVTILLLLCAALAGMGYFYTKYSEVKNNSTTQGSAQNSAETQRVVEKLKKLIRINETTTPTVARVEDPEELKKNNEEFYKDIEKGDYLIVYPTRAMIYRESNNQLINIAPIAKSGQQGNSSVEKP